MTVDRRTKYILNELKSIVMLVEAGVILDVAYVAIPTEGEPYMGFTAAPRKPEMLIAGLKEVAGWAGQTEKNAAIEKAQIDLAQASA